MALAIRHAVAGTYQPYTLYEVPLSAGIMPANTVVDTGYDLPDDGVVVDVFLETDTVEATATTKTMDVGIINAGESGDEDGFLDAISTAVSGLSRGSLTNGSVTVGAYMREVSGGAGEHSPVGYVLDGTKKSVCVTGNDAGGQDDFVGRLFFVVFHSPKDTGWRQYD